MAVEYYGWNFPFLSRTFVLPPQEGLRLIKNDILQLLLASPRERVKRRDYGTIIRAATFEPLDAALEAQVRESVRLAMLLFEKRVTLRDVIITRTPENYLMEIIVLCSLKSDPNIVFNVTAPVRINDEVVQ